MPTIEKKIIFSAQDNGVAQTAKSVYDKLSQSSKELADSIADDAAKMGGSSKEQIKYINEQIAAIQRRNNIESSRKISEARESYQSKLG
jgi:hypothetical protein